MKSLRQFTQSLYSLIASHYNLSEAEIAAAGIHVTFLEPGSQHRGDITTNAALVLARLAKKNPRLIAQELSDALAKTLPVIAATEIAGPGFINITLDESVWKQFVDTLTTEPQEYYRSELSDEKLSYLIEFVSANPTGPLHLGHGRNAIIGDALARALRYCGHTVATEFYINDAGSQVLKLGNSLKIRCMQEQGSDIAMPEDGYQGLYMVDLAKQCIAEHGAAVVEHDVRFFTDYAMKYLLQKQKEDLARYGVTFDKWFSEQTLHDSGAIEKALDTLKARGFLYENEGAWWFKSTEFGDDKDRVICKADGSYTYIAPDIAYHINKFERGYDVIVDILGQDHHGYVHRLKGTMQALGYDAAKLAVILYQLVSIKEGSIPVRMSKRAGTFTELVDVIDAVGPDAARFFFLHKKVESHLEIDISVALQQSQENPVFYLQYAYVRSVSLLKKAADAGLTPEASTYELSEDERALVKKALSFAGILRSVCTSHGTHTLAGYALEFAQVFHGFYTNNKIIDPANPEVSRRRLALVAMVKRVLATLHDILGLTKRESM